MNITIEKVTEESKDILFRLLQFALYDGSQYIDNEINSDGVFEYTYFDAYFTDPNRSAYFIKLDEKLAGFVMINDYVKTLNTALDKCIAEFLVMPYYRKLGIGKKAAFLAFDLFDGGWETMPMTNNEGANKFWHKTVNEYTNGDYETKMFEGEEVLVFKRK